MEEVTIALGKNVDNVGSVVTVDVQDLGPGPSVPVRTEGYHLVPRSVGYLLFLVFVLVGKKGSGPKSAKAPGEGG